MTCVRDAFGLRFRDRLVAAFAPFALYGPALGIASAVPDMDVTTPGTLTARALAEAVAAVDASLVFGAPAGAAQHRAHGTLPSTRPSGRAVRASGCCCRRAHRCPARLLRAASDLLGGCEAHTPYGMTEALPVADVDARRARTRPRRGNGILVGHPVPVSRSRSVRWTPTEPPRVR